MITGLTGINLGKPLKTGEHRSSLPHLGHKRQSSDTTTGNLFIGHTPSLYLSR